MNAAAARSNAAAHQFRRRMAKIRGSSLPYQSNTVRALADGLEWVFHAENVGRLERPPSQVQHVTSD